MHRAALQPRRARRGSAGRRRRRPRIPPARSPRPARPRWRPRSRRRPARPTPPPRAPRAPAPRARCATRRRPGRRPASGRPPPPRAAPGTAPGSRPAARVSDAPSALAPVHAARPAPGKRGGESRRGGGGVSKRNRKGIERDGGITGDRDGDRGQPTCGTRRATSAWGTAAGSDKPCTRSAQGAEEGRRHVTGEGSRRRE